MIRGRCLCGDVKLEIAQVMQPFELCHCSRCRKVTGSAFLAQVTVRREDFRWLSGRDCIRAFDAPILREPPAYRSCFCLRCGTLTPDPTDESPVLEVPAGMLEDDPGLRPDKHIFTHLKAPWFEIADSLPQLDEEALARWRESHA